MMGVDAQKQLEDTIRRMQVIQRAIRASGQPPSLFEITELKNLGREYARIVEQLAKSSGPDLA